MKILVIAARIVGHRCLQAILESGAEVAALLYLDDAKAGVTVAHAGFDDLIARYRLKARPFTTLKGKNGEDAFAFAAAAKPDLGIVVGVSELIGDDFLKLPPKGFIGMHPTLLPQGRGRAPIPWTLVHDLKETGVTLFYAEPGADSGDILDQERVPVLDSDTAPVLGGRTDDVACQLFVRSLPKLADGTAPRIKQDEARATVWPRRRPADGLIDWSQDERALYNWVRALTRPYPGAFTVLDGRKLFVWAAEQTHQDSRTAPGTILSVEDAALVAAGRGVLKLTAVQWEGGADVTPLAAGLSPGQRFGEAL
jgi:methionyl-tRNA formyltransferase